jgi:hypothetical protein
MEKAQNKRFLEMGKSSESGAREWGSQRGDDKTWNLVRV